MTTRRTICRATLLATAAGACALFGNLAAAQAFPSKPITLIVPNPPGGLVDG